MPNPEMIRVSFFLAVLCICCVWEWCLPRKNVSQNKLIRWLNNLGLVGLNSFLLNLLVPLMAFEAAIWAESTQTGLFQWLALPSG